MPVRRCSSGALLLLVLLAAVAAVALLTMIAPARAASAARGVRACTSLVQPDAHAIAASWECMLEVVSSLELVHLHRAAPTSAEALTGRQTHNVVPAGTLAWTPKISVQWFAPFWSGGGYCSEAISYVSELAKWLPVGIVQHGDGFNARFVQGLPRTLKDSLLAAQHRSLNQARTVQVCHSEPGAWSVPTPRYQTSECPTSKGLYKIGRTMFETDRLPDGWAQRLTQMDEIWVPTNFHRLVFEKAGVPPSLLQIIPEAVDTRLFDAAQYAPLEAMSAESRFKFLSVFKWEPRKGWDVLLRAFLKEFPARSREAVLYIRTDPYHSDSNFREQMERFAREELNLDKASDLDHIVILDKELPLAELPRLYKGADAFVLPSRGEGWGRPHIESMAMGVPTIATNWSGNTEFMLPDNSFLIPIDGLEVVKEGAFQGHLWASPSVEGLRAIMRTVVADPASARAIGARGALHVRTKYNPQAVAQVLLTRLGKIQDLLMARGLLGTPEL